MEKNKKAIILIKEALDLLGELKYMYARDNLNIAIKEINKASIKNENKTQNKYISKNPKLSLKMVEKIIIEEKNNLRKQ